MDSRNLIKDRRISYQWRLFIPMALTLWITIIGMAWFQVSRVEETRKQMALDQLSEEQIVTLDEERKAAMVSNLLVVLCADEPAQPVLNTGTLYQ